MPKRTTKKKATRKASSKLVRGNYFMTTPLAKRLSEDVAVVAEVTWHKGLVKRGIKPPPPHPDYAFVETARGARALDLLKQAGVTLDDPFRDTFWALRKYIESERIE